MYLDAMKAGAHAEAIFFSNTSLLETLPLVNCPSIQLYQLNHEKIQLWSDLTTSPGIMGKILKKSSFHLFFYFYHMLFISPKRCF